MRAAAVIAAGLAAGGCGFGIVDNTSGGGDNLPTLGAGPYGRLDGDFSTPAEEPFLLAEPDEAFAHPACRARGDGGLRLWFEWILDGAAPDTAAIGLAELPGLHDLPDVAPHEVFAATEAWEEGRVSAPAVIEDGGGLVMFYEGGVAAPAIGRADSDDDGETWTRRADPVLSDATDPSAVVVDGVWHLFFTRPGAPGIWRARSDDGVSFGEPELLIAARPGVDEAFDAVAVGAPFALVQTSEEGRRQWGLWFTGEAAGDPGDPDAGPGEAETAIGYAGSFDGEVWERFGGGSPDPVLTAPAGAPCVVLDGPRGTLLYHEEQRLHLGVAAAVHP
jgi:hypothetical protein